MDDLESQRVYYQHDPSCSGTLFNEPNDNGFKQCIECAGIFDSEGKGVCVTSKKFDELYN